MNSKFPNSYPRDEKGAKRISAQSNYLGEENHFMKRITSFNCK